MWRLAALALAGCGRIAFDPFAVAEPHATVYIISGDGGAPTDLASLDLATGQMHILGTLDPSLGVLGGLAVWDDNTLYATSTGKLVQITLVPFSAVAIGPAPGSISALERDGDKLLAGDQLSSALLRFDPLASGMAPEVYPVPNVDGGDVVHIGDTWYWFTNSGAPGAELFQLDAAYAPVPIGSPGDAGPYLSGLVIDDAGNLYGISDSDVIIPIDLATGAFGATTTMCIACPTPYDFKSGDATRSP